MKEIVVFGSAEIAQLAYFYFEKEGTRKVKAFVVDDAYKKDDKFCNLPLVATSQVKALYPPERYGAFVALSYAGMNSVRAQKCADMKALGYRLESYVSPHCTNFASEIGENCFILEDNTLQPFCKIGNNVTLWSGNHIGHHSTIGNNVFITSHVVVSGGVVIGNNSFVGVNCTLRDHITLGEACMIGAGCLLIKDVAPRAVYRAPKAEALEITSDQIKKI